MIRTSKLVTISTLVSIGMLSYIAGVVFAATKEKRTVSVYDLKQAVSALIDDINSLKKQVQMLTAEVLLLKKEFTALKVQNNEQRQIYSYTVVKKDKVRVRLSPWGKILGLVPKGTEVVLMKRKGDWCLTNLGYIHCSLLDLEVK